MNINKIHQTPEERLAHTSEQSVSLLKLTNEKLEELAEVIRKAEKEKSEPVNINVKLEII